MLKTLRLLLAMTWDKLQRISRSCRAVAWRDGPWLRLQSLHPDHDSASREALQRARAESALGTLRDPPGFSPPHRPAGGLDQAYLWSDDHASFGAKPCW